MGRLGSTSHASHQYQTHAPLMSAEGPLPYQSLLSSPEASHKTQDKDCSWELWCLFVFFACPHCFCSCQMYEVHLVQVMHEQMTDQRQKVQCSLDVPSQKLRLHCQLV